MYKVPLEFDHTKTFKRRAEIKPWLSKQLARQNLKVVIERSDNVKIVFRCRDGSAHCPFRIRGNHSLRTQTWSLSVVNDLHNHPVEHGFLMSKKELEEQQSTDMFVTLSNRPHSGSQNNSPQYLDKIVKKMSTEVAKLVSANIWQNHNLTHEQKESAVARFVAGMVDEYLGEAPKSNTAPMMPLSPLLNEPDMGTQLPALAVPTRSTGPLPPFNSLQNQLPPSPGMQLDAAKTLNPTQLLKAATHDLREFKVDNIGAPSASLSSIALGQNAPSPGDKIDGGLLANFNSINYPGW
ncbi:uncharacterized protein CXQ87_000593 [Candidozyma duobushaemuli]|uniref:Transposase MuDR plant domain-containing protein n=2 Tax=Candidozyma TaxID=3303203 RepID=A0ABX8HZR9_9ASCO|nr:uncharacterized protein CXQ87_000593 [[Candida] duobushaemulonis]PVH17700.1 hypothetical protein CXQ87_000593 [[Candida] duobushaemulonis]QWU86310.1 hypothetical protein CA3LBN_000528 [[Candida] haemuloni]